MKQRFRTVFSKLPIEIAEKLDILAEQSRRSKSAIIRILIEDAELADLVPAEAIQALKKASIDGS